MRPALGGEDRGDGFPVRRIRAEAVDRLGRKRDQPAVAQDRGGRGDGGRIRGAQIGKRSGHARILARRLAMRQGALVAVRSTLIATW